mmetsp:Transcript_233/g.464  ORF Transcript_233/g.464 Transcript_233/m.464 type:complete len:388 (+) Transcript_233:127-1290(+)
MLISSRANQFLKAYILVALLYVLLFRIRTETSEEDDSGTRGRRTVAGSAIQYAKQQMPRICQCHCPKQQCNAEANQVAVQPSRASSSEDIKLMQRRHNGPSEDCLLTLVLPIVESDLPRLNILDMSFNKFFNFSRVCEIVMIGIDQQYPRVLELVKQLHFPKYTKIRLVNESDVVPEFRRFPDTPNWIRQQIIKLAIAEKIKTKFYMCMDCDMLCVKPCGVDDLFEGEKGKTNMSPKDHLETSMGHWWDGAAKVLDMKIPDRYENRFGVTPAILSTDIALKLREHLELRFNIPWRQHLIDRIWDSWTEYCVYSTFAMASDLFDRYHMTTFDAVYKKFELSVWYEGMFATWPLDRVFDPKEPGCFAVVQSNTKIDASRTKEKVLKYIT